ncbi:hypothetical protein TEA_014592 [Camellia sinensis var. sinensis]|uniref:DUF4228 domain-containing protein n=1 Tax=Camellia sinensis var. sinensis TaxID=542762 RepID=A0A4S4E1G5_CAMSN|nr:hypothetical protein TEA_014592 [Camellia sinensis var. sinensis]
MGCCFSSRSSSSSTTLLKIIRVVHMNGHVEDFEHSVTVGEVIGKPPRHFVCTRAQLVSGEPKPLKQETQLELGNVYFMLPYSTIQSDVSPVDLASIAKKLNRIAKTSSPQLANKSPLRNFLSSGSSPVWSSPATSPNRFSGSVKAQSWKPLLDTIRERSFNRRSESDLQETQSIGDSKREFEL